MTLSFRRSLVIAGLVGSSLAAGFVLPVQAQTPPAAKSEPAKPPAAQAATSNKPETVEQRNTALKAALKITPDQESKWSDVAKAMHDNAAKMDKLIQEKRASQAKLNAVDDLKIYQDFAQGRLDGLKNLIPAFKTLYDSMPAEQKKNADHVFDSYGPPKSAQQG